MSALPKSNNRHNPNAPYRSPLHALRHAFAAEAKDVVEVSSYFADLRGGSVKLPSEDNDPGGPYERRAQSAVVLAFVHERLRPEDMILLRAKYTVPQSRMLQIRKSTDVKLLYDVLIAADPKFRNVHEKYAEDVLRGWAGYQRQFTDDEWKDKLRCHPDTLRFWRNGRRRRGGFVSWLRVRHDEIMSDLADAMFDAGLTQE